MNPVRRATSLVLCLTLAAGCDRFRRDRDLDNTDNKPPVQVPTTPPAGNGTPSGQPGFQFPTVFAPPGQAPAVPNVPATATLPPPPPGSVDGTGAFTPAFLQADTRSVFGELVGALSEADRARIAGIPLVITTDSTEVNAAAGCSRSGRAFMVITQALVTLAGAASEARGFDEIAGTNHQDDYLRETAAAVRGSHTVLPMRPGTLPVPTALDGRKLARQRYLFDEQIAFVLGHELAHHYRGHTGCANGAQNGGEVTPEDVARTLSNVVPIFNQPLELEADTSGTYDALDAGARHQGGAWTEEGAYMILGFFSRLTALNADTLLLGFMRTHPPPQLRIPWVQVAAQGWRSGSRPAANNPLPIPLPPGIQLPPGLPQLPFPIPIPR